MIETRKLRVGILCHASVGGSVRIAISLANALVTRGHTVHIFSTHLQNHQDMIHPEIIQTTLSIHAPDAGASELRIHWSDSDKADFCSLVAQTCQREKIDVLHFHYAVPFAEILSNLRARLGDSCPKLIGTLHGTDVYIMGRNEAYQPGIRKALLQMDNLTTVSQAHADLAVALYKLPAMPKVIPNFLDPSEWHPLHNRTTHGEERNLRIGHLSNFRPIKSVVDVGRIFNIIQSSIPAELWLLGDGPEAPLLMAYAKEEGFIHKIKQIGLTNFPAPYVQQLDLMVLASGYESFSMAALEAMACGVPVLAPKIGGLPQVVRHGQDGYLYPPGDVQTAASLALKLVNNPGHLARMGETAAVHVLENFSTDLIVTQYETLYY